MTEEEATPLLGYYYEIHDDCLYHVTYGQGKLYLSRCSNCGPDPTADKFSDPYEMAEGQLKRLLDFECFERADYQPAPPARLSKEKARGTLSLF